MKAEQRELGQHADPDSEQQIRLQQGGRDRDGKDEELVFADREDFPEDARLTQSPSDIDEHGGRGRARNPVDQSRSHPQEENQEQGIIAVRP